ncbi:hypothetical protein BDDG_13280, partial [Blastomyces dermatitidis ATCC 18188]
FLVAPAPEAILIEDDNAAETILFCSQTSFITFSLFSVKKIVCTLSCKCSVLSDSHCCLFSPAHSSVSFIFTFPALTSDSAGSVLFFNFST